MSECDYYSRREGFNSFQESRIDGGTCLSANKQSFLFSKIWMRSRMENGCGGRGGEEAKAKKSRSEVDLDVGAGAFCDSGGAVSRVDEMLSFARRTLLWVLRTLRFLMNKQK